MRWFHLSPGLRLGSRRLWQASKCCISWFSRECRQVDLFRNVSIYYSILRLYIDVYIYIYWYSCILWIPLLVETKLPPPRTCANSSPVLAWCHLICKSFVLFYLICIHVWQLCKTFWLTTMVIGFGFPLAKSKERNVEDMITAPGRNVWPLAVTSLRNFPALQHFRL